MNKVEPPPAPDSSSETSQLRDKETRKVAPATKPGAGRLVLCIAVLLLAGALGFGFWRHYIPGAQGVATAEQPGDSVLSVRTAGVRASGAIMLVTWPGTTEAFAQANIYARASGYISKRNVDIGSQVKAGDLLVEITAPELDHQIAQAEGKLYGRLSVFTILIDVLGKGQNLKPRPLDPKVAQMAKQLFDLSSTN
jgi:multidrug efflux pump subunit AcrA (membrane-fusion protein)